MDYLTEILADIEERVDDIQAIGDVNEDLVKIAVTNLQAIKKDLEATGKNLGVLQKIDRQLNTYEDVAKIPELTSKFPIIREQMVVLMIGALEVFIADIYRYIANNDPEYFFWNDEKEKISFDPAILIDGFTLGDVVLGHLKNKGYSFQDLQSLIKSFEVYCGIKIDLEAQSKDVLIFGAAARHIIVHSRSKIDSAFIKQIRNTQYSTTNTYKKDQSIEITDKFVTELGDTIKSFCGYVVNHIIQRDD